MSINANLPYQSPIESQRTDPATGRQINTGYIHPDWLNYLQGIQSNVDAGVRLVARPRLVDQEVSISPTPIPVAGFPGGLYRVSFYARITRPATVSSSLTIGFNFVEGGNNEAFTYLPLTTNTVFSIQSQSFLCRVDRAAAITYNVSYASIGATPMQYSLEIILEAIPESLT